MRSFWEAGVLYSPLQLSNYHFTILEITGPPGQASSQQQNGEGPLNAVWLKSSLVRFSIEKDACLPPIVPLLTQKEHI